MVCNIFKYSFLRENRKTELFSQLKKKSVLKYCAFLRGVNVNGTSMKMAEVCNVFSDVGMKKVSSVLASGNILFSSDKNISDLKMILEKAMSKYFNYEAFLFLKTEEEVEEIFKKNPFSKAENLKTSYHVDAKNYHRRNQN